MYSVVVAFGLASVMLCIGMAIRAKVKFFQHMLMPVSVIGGILGFILMNLVLSKYPVGGVSVTDFSNIVDVFFVMSFISIGLTGSKKKKNKKTEDGKKHKVYVIALIDDASRYIVGIDVFFNDNFVNLMSVMKAAVAKFGVPKLFNFDNGSSYKNKQMDLLAARIGSTVHYDQPYTPTQKAKVERWFRTMKDQWMAGLDMRDFHTLDKLRGSLYTYVSQYNQRIHSSLNGRSPQERYFSEPDCFLRLPEDKIDQLFLLELERRVSIDCVVTIDHIEYEVDYRFAKQRIKLRYSPDMESIYVVEADGTLTPIRLLNKVENADIKREKPRLYGGDD